jgi:predicted metal-binding membrane protein
VTVPAALLGLAAVGWWWSMRMTGRMERSMSMDMTAVSVSVSAFMVAWVAMMGAMMFPAIIPAVRLYSRAAGTRRVAPTPLFVAGYLLVWSSIGIPTYFAWRTLDGPIRAGAPWAGRLAGSVFIAAAIYQLTPLKAACLRHCRSPMSFFLHQRSNLSRPLGALRAGSTHGLICLGCCWALMAVLITLGTMQIWWMLGFAAFIFAEKVTVVGERLASLTAAGLGTAGLFLLISPHLITRLT